MNPYITHGAFSWNELMTSDPEAALRFYATLFGWKAKSSATAEGEYHELHVDGVAVGGLMRMPAKAAAGGMPPAWGCYVTVKDVDDCVQQAVRLGGAVLHGPADIPRVGRFAVIQDPQGAWLNVIAYTPPAG